jgi:nucleoside-diphosphate-sugar epimerase
LDTTLEYPSTRDLARTTRSELSHEGPRTEAELDEMLSRPTRGAVEALSHMDGDFLLLGASGKMGPTLAQMVRRGLDELGSSATVTAIARFSNPAVEASLNAAGVRTLRADLLDAAAVNALPDARNVMFMAGQKFGTSKFPELAWAMNTVVPAYVAERYRASNLLVFSTGCVYANSDVKGGGSVEGDDMAPLGDYANSCVGRERVFAWFAHKHHTPLSIFRLNYSIDLRYGVLVDVAQKVYRGIPVDVTMGYANVIWQGDANARAIQCLGHASVPPLVLNVTGSGTVSIREVALRFGILLNREAIIAGEEADTALLSNADRALRMFGEPEVPVEDMMKWTAAWLKNRGRTLGKPTHFEQFDGKY